MRCRRNQIHNSRAHRETLELEHSRRVILFKVSTCFECGSAWERQRHGITIECTYPKCVSLYVWHIEGVSLDACSSRCNVSASIQFSAAGKMIDDASYYQHRSGRVRRKCIDNKMQLNVGTVWNTRGSNFVRQEIYWFICGIYWFSRRLRGNLRVTVIIDHTEAINLHVFFCLLIQLRSMLVHTTFMALEMQRIQIQIYFQSRKCTLSASNCSYGVMSSDDALVSVCVCRQVHVHQSTRRWFTARRQWHHRRQCARIYRRVSINL